MTSAAIDVAAVVGGLCVLVGLWGAWLWWRVSPPGRFMLGVRVAQVACGLQAVFAGVVYVSGEHHGSGLYYLYAVLPVFVGFASEQLRILSAQTVLDARGLEDGTAVGALPEDEQRSVVTAILRRETGIMALGLLVIAFLCWRAAITI